MTEFGPAITVSELQAYPIFQDLSETEIRSFLEAARVRTFNALAPVVFRQGDEGDGLYVIVSGEVDIYASDTAMRKHLLGTLRDGDFFGEMSLVESKPRTASVEAKGEARIIFLDRNAFQSLQQKDPAMLNKLFLRMMAEMSSRLRQLDHRFTTAKAALTSLQSFS